MNKGYSILGWNHPGFGCSTVSIIFILNFILYLYWYFDEKNCYYFIILCFKLQRWNFGNVAVNINYIFKLNVIEVMARLLIQSNYDCKMITVRHENDYKGCAVSSPRRKCYRLCNAFCDRLLNISWGTNNSLWLEYWWIYCDMGCYELSFYTKFGKITPLFILYLIYFI